MGYQVVLRKLPTEVSHPVFSKTLCLEDVLVSTVFGALAYGPPAMLEAWLRHFTTMRRSSPELRLEFWPTQGIGRRRRTPDVFVLDEPCGQALIVEAKRDLPPMETLAQQLVEEAQAARVTHKGVRMHVLVVSDQASEPLAFEEVDRRHPRLYSKRMKHASWFELCGFLKDWRSRPECDAGHLRMIDDALEVMAKYGRVGPADRPLVAR